MTDWMTILGIDARKILGIGGAVIVSRPEENATRRSLSLLHKVLAFANADKSHEIFENQTLPFFLTKSLKH